MVEARALEDEKYTVLLNQQGVPDHKNCGIKPQDADRLMDVVLLHRS